MSEIGKGGTNFSGGGVYITQDADDRADVRRCLAGDPSAFEPLVVRYQRILYTVAVRIVGDPEDASDAAQAAFVKAYEKLATFDERRRFFSWIYRILVNECLNLRRDRHPHDDLGEDLPGGGTPEDLLAHRETRARVQAAILELPLAYREVIVLRHFTELSYDDIAGTLGIGVGVVKSRLFTARQRLAQLLLRSEQHV
jgi:RNA polymerase sigma-70 factor (ECF subfamily)